LIAAESAHEAAVAAVAACQCQIGEHAGADRGPCGCRGMPYGECTSQPIIADAGWPIDDRVLCLIDPAPGNYCPNPAV
jgi:hypothetical protein